jgi:hypothetical protein
MMLVISGTITKTKNSFNVMKTPPLGAAASLIVPEQQLTFGHMGCFLIAPFRGRLPAIVFAIMKQAASL